MSKSTAKEVEMWDRVLHIGDRVRIKYAYGEMGEIEGEVVELRRGLDMDGHLRGRLDSGWKFHLETRPIWLHAWKANPGFGE